MRFWSGIDETGRAGICETGAVATGKIGPPATDGIKCTKHRAPRGCDMISGPSVFLRSGRTNTDSGEHVRIG